MRKQNVRTPHNTKEEERNDVNSESDRKTHNSLLSPGNSHNHQDKLEETDVSKNITQHGLYVNIVTARCELTQEKIPTETKDDMLVRNMRDGTPVSENNVTHVWTFFNNI